ncbi:hypothetical protein CEE69_22015 [Rhodopirellula bahusiensis]|uniref:Uncharacterized protein n=1 Tax=Rhodopirellula bahusiensis TaxID=2014065 RepID=A0A2G1W2P6_9BACT|nr:hypothetical protein CEE69_22015 [Rhodopirellula bahusiensis]
MWSCPEKPIPKDQIEAEHRRCLRDGVADLADTGFVSETLRAAVAYFEDCKSPNRGYRLLREGIDQSDPRKVSEGYGLIEVYWAKEDAIWRRRQLIAGKRNGSPQRSDERRC